MRAAARVRRYHRQSHAVRAGDVHRSRSGDPPAVLHEPRRPGLRAHEPARGREGRVVRALLALRQEPAPPVPRRVRRRPRPHRRPHRRRDRRAPSAPRSSTTRVFLEYGDDSVAQLGGVHLACEQASNLLTKILEWGRLMAYLEQSTRYIPYDSRLLGRYRYLRPSEICQSRLARALHRRHGRDRSTRTARCCPAMMEWAREQHPKQPGDSDFVYKQTIKAKACDTVRGLLPGRDAVERRHLRHRPGVRGAAAAHARASAARGADVRAADARRAAQGHPVVPRPRRPARPRRRVDRRTSPRPATTPPTLVERLFGDERPEPADEVTLARLGPRRRGQGARRDLLPAHAPARSAAARAGAAAAGRRPRRADARVRRRAHEPPAQARAARSSARRTASTCSATTARSATCNATAC